MMDSFSEYISQVKAEEELKKNTEAWVRAALAAAENRKETEQSGRKRFSVPKLAVSAAAACLVLVVAGCALYYVPLAYLSVDINPSVELGINTFDRVVRTAAFNEDGAQLLEKISCSNLPVEDAVSALVRQAGEQGYLSGDGTSVIAVTAQSNHAGTSAQVLAMGESGVQRAMRTGALSAVLYSEAVDLSLRAPAKEEGLSAGKYRLIQLLQEMDPDISITQYKEATVAEIISQAEELLNSTARAGAMNAEDAAPYEGIRKAAMQVMAAAEQGNNGNGEQKMNQSSGPQQQQQGANQKEDAGPQQADQPNPDSAEQEQNQNRNDGTPGMEQELEQNQNLNQGEGSGSSSGTSEAGRETGAQDGAGNAVPGSGGPSDSGGGQGGRKQ